MDEFKEEQRQERVAKQSNDINLLNMIESRITEIIQIEDECKRKLPKLFNQRLPRFMRRRAACHDHKRLPKKLRPSKTTQFGSKSRKALIKYHRRTRFQKHKRVLRKHGGCKFKDPAKFLLHKWFAKRFKINRLPGPMSQIPIHNSTKNQRNLYRQTRYGCAYLSLAHLMPIVLEFDCPMDSFVKSGFPEDLSRLVPPVSGFTFCATALKKGRYELVMFIHSLAGSCAEDGKYGNYICPANVSISESNDQATENLKKADRKTRLTLWVPRLHRTTVTKNLKELIETKLRSKKDNPQLLPCDYKDWARVRLMGPDAHKVASSVGQDAGQHKSASEDARTRLNNVPCLSIGRYLEEDHARFVYYNTKPLMVDVIFKGREGRLLWYKLVKNKAHLVGGYRDIDVLITGDSFRLAPESATQKESLGKKSRQ